MRFSKRVLFYLSKYRLAVLGSFLSILMVNAANIAGPYLLRMLIDKGILSLSMEWVWKTVAGLFLVAVAKGVFNFTQGYLSEYAAQGVAYELRNAIFEKLNKLSFSYHDQAQTGKLMTRMTSDVEQVRSFISQGLIQLISAIALLIGTVIMLFNMSWQLTLVALIFVPITIGIMSYFIRNVMPIAMRVQKLFGQLNTIMQENLAGIRIVKAFSREEYELNRYRAQNEILLNENLVFIQKITALIPLVFFVGNLAVVGILAFGVYQVIGKQLTLGELVAFLGYNSFLLMPIFMMGMIGAVLSRAEVSAQRIFEVLDAQVEVKNSPDAIVLPRLKGDVTFDDVSFRYFKGGEDVLSHVSFSVKAGQLVAILGKTGSGKSTIINLIPRFYDVSEGRVLVDGFDVRKVTIESLRNQIGIVLQETTLFSGTVRENISYGKPQASLDEIIEVAKAAQAHEFISRLPDGYDTIIGERGVGLSGGQKQRIAIARALLLDPRILILDDSTSSVDASTEYYIQEALKNLMKGRTSFIIAQRISTVRNADMILLLDNGKLIAQGTHEELMQTSEAYVNIIHSQLSQKNAQYEIECKRL